MTYQGIFGTLSPEQIKIAKLPASTQLLVLAGPGTGKTHTLIRRLVYLIMSEGLLPHRDLLVVSFSRAAVAEIRGRLAELVKQGAPDDLRFLNIRTFDSLATRLMVAANEEIDLSDMAYDARISLAVKHLSDPDSSEVEIVGRFRHLVVDEIQDLVGVRAQLIQRILSYINGGFTLMGDPAQGIYDYLVNQNSQGLTSLEFLNWVRETWDKDLVVRELDHNYRSVSASSLVASRARNLVLGKTEDNNQAYQTLREIVHDLGSAGSINQPEKSIFFQEGKRIALLCRTNSEVLFGAEHLIIRGIPCLIPPSVEEKGIPAWVGRIFSAWTYTTITEPVFQERWRALITPKHQPGKEQAWNLLKALEGRDQKDLNLEVLKSRLRRSVDWTFDSEAQNSAGIILTTTIHQSKGREYDTVVILAPETSGRMNAKTALEEARVLYVAATRARDQVLRLGRQGLPIMYASTGPSGRERYIGQGAENEHFFETGLPGDIDDCTFVSKALFPEAGLASSVQELIWKQLIPGAKIGIIPQGYKNSLRLILVWLREGNKNPLPICFMDTSYRADLEQFLRSKSTDRRWRFIPLMTGLQVYERRTLILPPYPQGVHEPYATSGFCLGVAIKGVAYVG
jgi:hypothetical protein